MAGDLHGPRTWYKHRLRTGVPAHSDQPAIYGGDHAATSDVANLLRLHRYSVANLDHDRLLWMVTKPGHPSVPTTGGSIQDGRGKQFFRPTSPRNRRPGNHARGRSGER